MDTPARIRTRRAVPADAGKMIRVHRRAVRGAAASTYPAEIVTEWAPLPVAGMEIAALAERLRRGEEIALVARDGADTIVGFGSCVPGAGELSAVYVDPDAGRRGVGRTLLRHLEVTARDAGANALWLDSSENAADFYADHGYAVSGRGVHTLRSGREMRCIHMRKTL